MSIRKKIKKQPIDDKSIPMKLHSNGRLAGYCPIRPRPCIFHRCRRDAFYAPVAPQRPYNGVQRQDGGRPCKSSCRKQRPSAGRGNLPPPTPTPDEPGKTSEEEEHCGLHTHAISHAGRSSKRCAGSWKKGMKEGEGEEQDEEDPASLSLLRLLLL